MSAADGEQKKDEQESQLKAGDHFNFSSGIYPNPSPGAGRRRRSFGHSVRREGIFSGNKLRQIAFALLAADIFLCPFALGGAPLWSVALSALLGGVSLAAATASLAVQKHRFLFSAASAAMTAAICVMVFQLIPLPAALLSLLSPETHQALSDSLSPLGGTLPSLASLSLDAPATARALLTCLACLAAYLSAFQLASSDQKVMRQIAAAAAFAALGIALTGCFHWLSGAELLFGFFKFSEANPPLLTPFGNPNHLASFLAVGAVMTSALAMSAETPLRRLSWWLAYAVTAIALFLSLSRAGFAAFIVSQMLFAFCCARFLSSETRESRPKSSLLLAALVLSAAMMAGLFIASDRIIAEWIPLTQSGLDGTKLTLVRKTAELISRYRWFGVGKDAFEPVFQSFLETPGDGLKTFTHPENILADWCAGFGIPIGLALLAAFAWAFWRGLRSADKSVLRWGALAAVFAAFLDDLFNFSLSFIGTAVPAAVVFAVGTAHRHRGVVKIPIKAAAAAGPLLILLGALSLSSAKNDLRTDGDILAKAAQQNADRDTFFKAFETTALRHPMDYFPRLMAAEFLLSRGDIQGSLSMAGQAMRLFPALCAPHEAAARALMAAGADVQATTEWILALERGSSSAAQQLTKMALENRVSLLALEGFADQSPERAVLLAQRLVGGGAADPAEIILRQIERTYGHDAFPEVLKTRCAAASKKGDKEAYLSAARSFDAVHKGQSEDAALLLADALCGLNQCPGAITLLETRIAAKNSAALRLKLARIFLNSGLADEARNALKNMPLSLTRKQRIASLSLDAAISLKAGDNIRRIQALRSLAALEPQSETIGLKLAEALADNGSIQEALDEVRRVIRQAEKKQKWSSLKQAPEPPVFSRDVPTAAARQQASGQNAQEPKEDAGKEDAVNDEPKILQRARALESRLQEQRAGQKDEAMKRRFRLPPPASHR